jgi:hypothetical protein
MKVNTNMAEALVIAAARCGGQRASSWVARNVADKALHTNVGQREVKAVNVHCRARTRDTIAQTMGVDVWA